MTDFRRRDIQTVKKTNPSFTEKDIQTVKKTNPKKQGP
jgi:hypothetical protein